MDPTTGAPAEAAVADTGAPAGVAPETTSTPSGTSTPTGTGEGPTGTVPESFTNIDPNSLPPELSGLYKSMQADYTRKMQEAAQYRQYAELGDYEQARLAVDLVNRLQNDSNYAVQFYQELDGMLRQHGLLESNQPQVQPPAQPEGYDDPYAEPEDQLARELEEIKAWREQIEQERLEAQYSAEIDRQISIIRQSNPNYSDDDIGAITGLAFAYGGDLLAAESAYKQMHQRWASSYLETKANVPSGLDQPPVTGGAQQPRRFTDLNDPELERAALERLNRSYGQQ